VIYTAAHVRRDLALACDLVVVGSGAGGAPVAEVAARAGKRVVVLEAGSYWRPRDMTRLEHEMFPRLFHEKAGRTTLDRSIHVHQGKGVGGSTLHNLSLCKRIPREVLDEWRGARGLASLAPATLEAAYDDVERRLSVRALEEPELNANNRAAKRGCEALGYRGAMLRINRVGCRGAGYCELGCPFDAKENALKVYIASAVEAGAAVLADTWAVRVRWSGRRASGVDAVVRDPETGAERHRVSVEARAVCVSASATGTPALLLRSEVPDPRGLVGSRLFLHPGAAAAGVFDEPIYGWTGIPQSWECTEFLDFAPGSERRVWILPAFAHPVGVSAILGGFGAEHARRLADYPRLAAITAMVHDESPGRVRARGAHGVAIDYALHERDAAQLALGLRESARILLAAGARRATVPLSTPLDVERLEDVDRLLGGLAVRPHDLDIAAVHPMGTVFMGDDPERACVDASGRYHRLENLFVADASLFPGSIGGPPQLTIYALGTIVGRAVVAHLG
jgi:choline dehydrogenase-like flavoprotein